MKRVAFACCVNYSDMLAITYPHNKKFFDDYIIVTSTDDLRTQDYCKKNDIILLISDSYKRGTFNRAAMLNVAIDYCEINFPDSWLCSIDVDVVMDVVDNIALSKVWVAGWCSPDTMQEVLFGDEFIDKDLIYGCPRKLVIEKCDTSIESLRSNKSIWERYPYNLCAYIGYFQMFFKKSARNDESYKTVNNSDTAFLDKNFGINKARTFRNLVCYHLGVNGVNWDGRVSEEWK